MVVGESFPPLPRYYFCLHKVRDRVLAQEASPASLKAVRQLPAAPSGRLLYDVKDIAQQREHFLARNLPAGSEHVVAHAI